MCVVGRDRFGNWREYMPNFEICVYFESAWYINFRFGVYEKFGIFLLEGKGLVKQ